MWNIGNGVSQTLPASNAQRGDVSAAAARLRCVVSTPLGTPVVPEVYICTIVSPAAPRAPGSVAGYSASHASYSAPAPTTRSGGPLAAAIRRASRRTPAPRQQRRAGVADDRLQLGRRQAPVERHEHRADLARGEQQLDDLGAGAVQVRDARPGPAPAASSACARRLERACSPR